MFGIELGKPFLKSSTIVLKEIGTTITNAVDWAREPSLTFIPVSVRVGQFVVE